MAETIQLCCHPSQHEHIEQAFCACKPQDRRVRPKLRQAKIAVTLVGVEGHLNTISISPG